MASWAALFGDVAGRLVVALQRQPCPIGEPLGCLDGAAASLVGEERPRPAAAGAGDEAVLAAAEKAAVVQVLQQRPRIGLGPPCGRVHHLSILGEQATRTDQSQNERLAQE